MDLSQIKKIGTKFVYNAVHVVGVGLIGEIPKILSDKTWLYLPGEDCPFYRVSLFSRYSDNHVPKAKEQWSLLCEASEKIVGDTSSSDRRKKEILRQTISSLMKYGLIKDKEQVISIFHRRLDQGYPVPFLKRDKYLSIVQPWLESNQIYSRGRFGGWKYEVSNQDHSYMQGVEVVDKIFMGIPEMTYNHPDLVNNGLDSGRQKLLKIRDRRENTEIIQFTPFRMFPDVTYVIAHYNEDLSWLTEKNIARKSHVYHKGGKVEPNFDVWQWESLPNLGRESHTYLTYIIKNYSRLPEIVVFLQGRIDDHLKYVYQDPTDYVEETRKLGTSFKNLISYSNWDRIKHTGIFSKKMADGKMKKMELTLGEFWKTLFGVDHPMQILMTYGACFGVQRSRILAHPLSFYQMAISYVSNHQDPEAGHYFERLWYSIMTIGDQQWKM
jgi:hypothetical protein